MFMEIALAMGIDLEKDVRSEMRKEIARVCKSRFEIPGGVESEDEMIFRIIIEKIQKRI